MTDPQPAPPTQAHAPARSGRLALAVALLALVAATAPWLGIVGTRDEVRARSESLAKVQRRVTALEDRLERERDELDRLATRLGVDTEAEDSLVGRIARLEQRLDEIPGGARGRTAWLLDQAEHFLRIATAQENLAGDSASALTALEMADEHLRTAADPRFTPVRRLVAAEMSTLRSLPRVDVEGLALRMAALAEALPGLPRRQGAPASFRPETAAPEPTASGLERAMQAVRNALLSIVSIRRTDTPSATLLSDESAVLLLRSLDLELQMARYALLRGDASLYRSSLTEVRRDVAEYFDTAAAPVTAALATIDELAAAALPESRPDVSASLAELLKLRQQTEAGS